MKKLLSYFLFFSLSFYTLAEKIDSISVAMPDSLQIDSLLTELARVYELEKNLTYETGSIDLQSGLATLNVPAGFKFLNAEQSRVVLSDLWGNPPDFTTLGMLFPEQVTPLSDSFSYAVEITYSEEGYIDDEDAKDLNYDDMLKQMQEDTRAENKTRIADGYPGIELIGWAQSPFYDSDSKKLHWAKELKFDGYETNTLNYNIRVLGRKGVLVLNVISNMDKLEEVKANVPTILSSVNFNEGNRYEDFNPSIDKVAAYGIGGLIAGKILAKAGLLALLAKFWKLILFGIVAAFTGLRKLLSGKKTKEEQPGQEQDQSANRVE